MVYTMCHALFTLPVAYIVQLLENIHLSRDGRHDGLVGGLHALLSPLGALASSHSQKIVEVNRKLFIFMP